MLNTEIYWIYWLIYVLLYKYTQNAINNYTNVDTEF